MRTPIAIAALVLAALAIGAAAGRPQPEATSAELAPARSIRILEAEDDHGVIRLKVRIIGWRMYPRLLGKAPRRDGGHWRIYVNGRYNNLSTSPTRGSTNPRRALAPGTYRITTVLAHNNYRELRPRVRSNVALVTVERPEETTETTE